jgi:hypothetical protein
MASAYETLFPIVAILVLFLGIAYALVSRFRRMKLLRSRDYQWYKLTHPDYAQDGSLRCFRCRGNRIHVRGLMGGTYHREHFCVQCGTTLYYSPEG